MKPTPPRIATNLAGSLAIATLACTPAAANDKVHVSRFWHNHQPTYWPEWNQNGPQTQRVQYAWDSIVLKPSQNYGGLSPAQHPENNLTDIFGLDDRRNSYQGGPRAALAALAPEAGFAISYSGSLIDGVRQLGSLNQLGYSASWANGFRESRQWLTPAGSRRMDLVGFTYHHSLAPLLPKSVLRKEIQTFQQAYWKAWGGRSDLADHSKGFFPTEMAYSRHIIDVLVDEGYEWLIVPSHHISRTSPSYNNHANPEGSYQIYSSPPNRADQLGPEFSQGWWYGMPNPGNAAWNVAPYAYQLHRVKHVDPATGAEKTMIAVPSDDVLSYRYGYANEGIQKIRDHIAPFTQDPARPVIVMPATDGDNAWGGGSSSWFEATPQLFNDSAAAGYRRSSPQDFVNAHAAAAPLSHIEDGAWIFPEMCYGSPNFLKWIEPPVANAAIGATNRYPGTQIDMETPGFALKFYSYAPLMAGANWVETAEQILRDEGGSVQAWKIASPYDWDGSWTQPNPVELAWHIYLHGLDSGFNYYGGLGNDDEVKPGLATRRAVETLGPWLTTERRANDRTPPTVLKPQRFPYNPGAYTFGWFNSIPGGDTRFLKKMPSEFYLWTHAYDLSGIPAGGVVAKVRIDADGTNPLPSNQNETYAGGPEVGPWISLPMTRRELPKTRAQLNAAAANSQIDYFLPSPEVADYYFAKITEESLPGFRGKLLDYYIEATDARGNIHRSDIQHVFVEDDNGQGGGGTTPDPVVSLSPAQPAENTPVTITYRPTDRPLASAQQVYLHLGRNGWKDRLTPRPAMTLQDGVWTFTLPAWPGTTMLDMVFTSAPENGSGTWDNNNGQDWHFSVSPASNPEPTDPPPAPSQPLATVLGHDSIRITWPATTTADDYRVFRNDEEIALTAATTWTDLGLSPATTYRYAVAARNAAGSSAPSPETTATTQSTPPPTPEPIPFVMDGNADAPGYLLANPGMILYAAVRGNLLYLATWAPGSFPNDHFLLVGSSLLPAATTPAPWAKSGFHALPPGSPYLAAESSNNYMAWFQTNGALTQNARAAGQLMEGTLRIDQAFATPPATLHLAALAYQTADAGLLAAQAPATGIDNGNIDPSEFLSIPLDALRDEDANGIFDLLDPSKDFHITRLQSSPAGWEISLRCFPGRRYAFQSSPAPAGQPWTDIPDSSFTAPQGQIETTRSLPASPDLPRLFFRAILLP